MDTPTPLLALEDVVKTYGAGSSDETPVLAGVNLALAEGESLAIVGPSGSGKSTLLSIAGTLEAPTGGRVLFQGRDLASLSAAELAHFRNREVGFVFQHHHLLPQLSALENALLPTLATGKRVGGDALGRAEKLLEQVGLAARTTHRPSELSGGERQRVAVVRALINRPRLLLADEPTGSLDAHSAASLAELLVELNRVEGVALLLVTHAAQLAKRMGGTAELEDGRLARRHAAPASG